MTLTYAQYEYVWGALFAHMYSYCTYFSVILYFFLMKLLNRNWSEKMEIKLKLRIDINLGTKLNNCPICCVSFDSKSKLLSRVKWTNGSNHLDMENKNMEKISFSKYEHCHFWFERGGNNASYLNTLKRFAFTKTLAKVNFIRKWN